MQEVLWSQINAVEGFRQEHGQDDMTEAFTQCLTLNVRYSNHLAKIISNLQTYSTAANIFHTVKCCVIQYYH